MYKLIYIIFLMFILNGCGSSSGSDSGVADGSSGGSTTHDPYLEVPENSPCKGGEFYRIKTKECRALKHPSWGFAGFEVPAENIYKVESCTQKALESTLSSVPSEGGKVVLPECTFVLDETIGLYDNVILEGAGVGKTVITGAPNDMLSLRGKNIIVRGMTFDGKGKSLGGIVGTNNKGNILIENVEIKDLRGSGIYLVTAQPQENCNITIRQNSISKTLHGIVVKMLRSAKMLIYSNNLFDNREYGIDMSTTSDIEVSGNYMHDNYYAGAKSPAADEIYYYCNDINYNGKDGARDDRAGIIYMGTNVDAKIYLEENDLRNNNGMAYASWDAHFHYILLKNNLSAGSYDSNGYNIRATGIDVVDVYGDNGKIWVGEGNQDVIVYH